jgi:Protein of unknown function (DUF3515)
VATVTAAALASCGSGSDGAVEVHAPTLQEADARTCRSFVDALPATLDGQPSRAVTPASAPAAAWGDPAIVVTCGVGRPADFTDTSTCVQVNGVGWFVPDSVLLSSDNTKDVTFTAVGYRPRVQVFLPGQYRPEGFATVTAVVGKLVGQRLHRVQRCH